LLCLLLLAGSLQAMEDFEIEADEWDVDGREGTAIYQGNVEIRHGQLTIKADRAEFYESEPGVFERAVMTGEPVTLLLTPEDGPRTEGQARRIEYKMQTEQLSMEGAARLSQQGRDMRAQRIDYDMPNERIRATRAQEDGERVRVRFESGQDKSNGGNDS